MLDLLIKNGKIVDGTGNPWYYSDIGIKDGMIAQIGKIDTESSETIDASHQVVAPGFIDGHTHSDLLLFDQPYGEIKLQQGITTEVVGNCGLAPAPLSKNYTKVLQGYIEPYIGKFPSQCSWESIEEYMKALESIRPSENIATYVAQGALRIAVMGFEKRTASTDEMMKMKCLLEGGLKAGAVGLTVGLLYAPGSYTPLEELIELCKVLAKYNALLSIHIRGEGNNLIPSIKEALYMAEKAGVRLHISHFKAAGKSNWGKVYEAMELIENARIRGLDVTCDVYPYTAGSTGLTTLLPPWVQEGGIQNVLNSIGDKNTRSMIKQELSCEQQIWDNLVASTGWESVIISAVNSEKNKLFEGISIAQIASLKGQEPIETAMDLLIEEAGKISIIYFHMAEQDVKEVIKWDKSFIISDSLGSQTGKPHPRLYGSFPRLFAKYVREDKLISLEEAVKKQHHSRRKHSD